jgi:hypothetical protein
MERIGFALYCAATAIAAVALGIAVMGLWVGEGDDRFLIEGLVFAFGVTVWLLGFACWKALSGSPLASRRPTRDA